MTDIVERLLGLDYCEPIGDLGKEAADTITTLRADNAALREGLAFYANNHKYPSDGPWGVNSDDFGEVARRALLETNHVVK